MGVVEEMFDQVQSNVYDAYIRRHPSRKNKSKSRKTSNVSSHDHTFMSADGARISFVTAKETEQ